MSSPAELPVPLSAHWKGTFVGVLVLVATIICSGVLHFRAMSALQKEVQDKLQRTAMAIAARVDGDLHKTFTRPEQETTADYRRALKPLEEALYWKRDGKPLRTDYRYIYTCVMDREGKVFFVLDATPAGQIRSDGVEEKSHIMQPYPDASYELMNALRTGNPEADREPYHDQWGTFVSGYAPFYDSAGKQVGVVGVDWKAETYSARLAGIRRAWYLQMCLCLVSGFLSGVGTGMALVRRERAEAARRHADEEARRNRERWRIMVETLPKPAAHLQDGEFWINEPLEKCLGYRHDEIATLDQWFTRLWGDGEAAAKERAAYETDRASGFVKAREFTLRTAGGALRSFEFTAHAYNPGEVWLLEDITEEKVFQSRLIVAREEAEAAVQAKGVFLATVSHEIRTPMNGVIGMTNLMLETTLEPHQREMAEMIRNSGEALVVVINDILDYSKIESGGMEIESEPFDLRACIEDCLELFASLAGEKGLALVGTIPATLPAVIRGDQARLRQVLCNLIGNAIKFTERGEVEVRVLLVAEAGRPSSGEAEEGEPLTLRIEVRDTGIGIPADRLGRLFRSFSQVDASTARKYGGTGLGLAISRRLVELMGGVISVESKSGAGSLFYFTLPTTVEPAPEDDVQTPAILNGRRVLVVEAHAAAAEAIAVVLRQAGMICTIARDQSEARNALQEPCDLVIIDLQLSGGGGLGWWRETQAGLGRCPRVLAVSAILREGLREEARAAGMVRVLQKPVRAATLWQAACDAFSSAAENAATTLVAAEAHALAAQHPLRILVVEDNPVNRLVEVRMFERFGYGVDVVTSGYEVVAAVQARAYDVVFMDVRMPGLNGYDATKRIRALLPAERCPWIVALTANALNEDRETCLREGMDDYVSKPIRVAELERALRAVPRRG